MHLSFPMYLYVFVKIHFVLHFVFVLFISNSMQSDAHLFFPPPYLYLLQATHVSTTLDIMQSFPQTVLCSSCVFIPLLAE